MNFFSLLLRLQVETQLEYLIPYKAGEIGITAAAKSPWQRPSSELSAYGKNWVCPPKEQAGSSGEVRSHIAWQ